MIHMSPPFCTILPQGPPLPLSLQATEGPLGPRTATRASRGAAVRGARRPWGGLRLFCRAEDTCRAPPPSPVPGRARSGGRWDLRVQRGWQKKDFKTLSLQVQ